MRLDARACAARVLLRVINDGRSLSDALPPAVQKLADPRQRALVQELSFGTLRWYYRLDALRQRWLQKSLKQRDADVRCLLLTGCTSWINWQCRSGLPSMKRCRRPVP